MKSQTRTGKAKAKTNDAPARGSSDGQRGIAIAPPDYGFAFVDHGMPAAAASPLPMQLRGDPRVEERLPGKTAAAPRRFPFHTSGTPDENRIGLPGNLKSSIESLSGLSMDHVKVHWNSSQPARLSALAFAQGSDIHLAPGQERHLPHEAWHVVQQAQGRVQPTMQMKDGVSVNDDRGLESEADVMGTKALAPAQLAGGGPEKEPLRMPHDQVATASTSRPSTSFRRQERAASSFLDPVNSSPRAARLQLPKANSPAPPVIQAYKTVNQPTASRGTKFVSQSVNPQLSVSGGFIRSRKVGLSHTYTTTKPGSASVLAADDDTLAINATQDEPKEFFATPQVIAASNKELAYVDSRFELGQGSGSLTIGQKTLVAVEPTVYGDAMKKDANNFADLLQHLCINMTGEVMGSQGAMQSNVVLGTGANQETVGINPTGTADTNVKRLVNSLSTNAFPNTPANAAAAMKNPNNDPGAQAFQVARQYGQRSGGGQLNQTFANLGINKHAAPEIGEGFAIFSNLADQAGKYDYSALDQHNQPTEREPGWGYHFAGVVARSLDGQDWVTLENYNREPQIQEKGRAIRAEILRKYGQALAGLNADMDKSTFGSTLAITHQQAYNEYLAILQSSEPSRRWFFQIYGSGQGQSFHEKQGRSGAFVNPLTLRVRKLLETAKADKLARVDETDKEYESTVAAITNAHARQGMNKLLTFQRASRANYDSWIGTATSDADLRNVVARIKQHRSDLFDKKQVLPGLNQAYRILAEKPKAIDAVSRAALLQQARASATLGLMDVIGDFMFEMHQGVPDVILEDRRNLALFVRLLEMPDLERLL